MFIYTLSSLSSILTPSIEPPSLVCLVVHHLSVQRHQDVVGVVLQSGVHDPSLYRDMVLVIPKHVDVRLLHGLSEPPQLIVC